MASVKDLDVGDVVRLKSAGPEMTVMSVSDRESLRRQWFAGKKRETGYFPAANLVLVEEDGDGD